MKISTKGRYGLRSIVDLAFHSNGESVSLVSIAERQGISKNYLEQVFSALKKSGIVKSVKGSQGGYYLADKASNIKVGDILRALEGDLSVVDHKNDSEVNEIEACVERNVWRLMNSKINEVVDSITLEDLVSDYRKSIENFVYYI